MKPGNQLEYGFCIPNVIVQGEPGKICGNAQSIAEYGLIVIVEDVKRAFQRDFQD
jgi:hypothetical protein